MPKSLLVADDSLTIRKAIAMVFSTEDVQVTAVDNGLDAISKAREFKPDLVLADAAMPGKSGYEVCEALKSDPSTRSIPVLLLSGSFEPFDEGRARAVGADGHVAKPFESQSLIDRVKGVVGSWESGQATTPAPAQGTPAPSAPLRPSAPLAAGPRPVSAFPPAPSVSAPPAPFAPPRPGQPMPMPGQALRSSSAAAAPAASLFGRGPSAPAPPWGTVGTARPPVPGAGRPPAGRPTIPQAPTGLAPPPAAARPVPGIPAGLPRPPIGAPPFRGPPPAPPARSSSAPTAPAPAALHAPAAPAGARPGLSGDGGEAVLREALSQASREVIEKIAWEVVPQLAETIIREQLDRLIKERVEKTSN